MAKKTVAKQPVAEQSVIETGDGTGQYALFGAQSRIRSTIYFNGEPYVNYESANKVPKPTPAAKSATGQTPEPKCNMFTEG